MIYFILLMLKSNQLLFHIGRNIIQVKIMSIVPVLYFCIF
jgi:hypothetical protein